MMSGIVSQIAVPVARATHSQRVVGAVGSKHSTVQGKKVVSRTVRASRRQVGAIQVVRAVAAPLKLPDITLENDAEALTKSMLRHFQYTLGEDPATIGSSPAEAYRALAYTVSERLAANFKKTQDHFVAVSHPRNPRCIVK